MRKMAFVLAGLLLPAAVAPAVEIESEIKEVTVYTDRAQVTRSGAVELPAGVSTVAFPLLPPGLRDESVRVRAHGPGVITGTRVRKVFLETDRRVEVEELRRRLESLRDERKEFDDELEAVGLQRKFVSSIQSSVAETTSRDMLHRPPAPDEWEGVLEFIGASTGRLAARARRLEAERRELDRRIEAAEKELRRLETARGREGKSVEVTVDSGEPSRWQFELSYQAPNAGWRPSYDVRVRRADGSLDLAVMGEVRQATGEDWENVDLVLSTARPAIWGRPPRLSPWHIGLRRPAAAEAPRERALYMARQAFDDEKAIAAPPETAEARRFEGVSTFHFPRPQSVPSDNEYHGLVASRLTTPARFELEAFPHLVDHVYLKARLTNDWGFPLLPGRANLFLGPDFVGNTHLQYLAVGEETSVFLGVDEEVVVKRELVSEKADTGGLLRRGTAWREFAWRITVSNLKETPAAVKVFDQLPVSRDPDVKVELKDSRPAPDDCGELVLPGLICWELELEAGEERAIEYEFRVEFPRDREVEGL